MGLARIPLVVVEGKSVKKRSWAHSAGEARVHPSCLMYHQICWDRHKGFPDGEVSRITLPS